MQNVSAGELLGRREHKMTKSDPHLSRNPISAARTPDGVEDRTGHRRGALAVVGFWAYAKNHESTKWVVRCDCGMYTVRSGRSLRRVNIDDMCLACYLEKKAFRQAFHAKHGRDPEYFELPG